MSGIFDIKKGAFDSSEAARLHEAYAIALQGLRSTHNVDRLVINRLARSVVKVAQSEPDCLRNDGTIDPVRLAQRAILRMLQTSAPALDVEAAVLPPPREKARRDVEVGAEADVALATPDSPSKVMMRLFERTPFAKL